MRPKTISRLSSRTCFLAIWLSWLSVRGETREGLLAVLLSRSLLNHPFTPSLITVICNDNCKIDLDMRGVNGIHLSGWCLCSPPEDAGKSCCHFHRQNYRWENFPNSQNTKIQMRLCAYKYLNRHSHWQVTWSYTWGQEATWHWLGRN